MRDVGRDLHVRRARWRRGSCCSVHLARRTATTGTRTRSGRRPVHVPAPPVSCLPSARVPAIVGRLAATGPGAARTTGLAALSTDCFDALTTATRTRPRSVGSDGVGGCVRPRAAPSRRARSRCTTASDSSAFRLPRSTPALRPSASGRRSPRPRAPAAPSQRRGHGLRRRDRRVARRRRSSRSASEARTVKARVWPTSPRHLRVAAASCTVNRAAMRAVRVAAGPLVGVADRAAARPAARLRAQPLADAQGTADRRARGRDGAAPRERDGGEDQREKLRHVPN